MYGYHKWRRTNADRRPFDSQTWLDTSVAEYIKNDGTIDPETAPIARPSQPDNKTSRTRIHNYP